MTEQRDWQIISQIISHFSLDAIILREHLYAIIFLTELINREIFRVTDKNAHVRESNGVT